MHVRGREIMFESNKTRFLIVLKNGSQTILDNHSRVSFLHDNGEKIERDGRVDPLKYNGIKSIPLFVINIEWSQMFLPRLRDNMVNNSWLLGLRDNMINQLEFKI